MNWYSQAGQDRFVYTIHGDAPGTFLDVGCHHPIYISNTYALEQIGWRGLLIDIDSRLGPQIAEKRMSPFLCTDATTIDWADMIENFPCRRLLTICPSISMRPVRPRLGGYHGRPYVFAS